MTPGDNLLLQALQVIAPQTVKYYAQTARTINDAGVWVSTYAPGVDVEETSTQAVDRSKYQQMGLDYQKNYLRWFVPLDVIDLQRDRAGDQFEFNSRRWQLVSETDWFVLDGWTCALAIDVGAATGDV